MARLVVESGGERREHRIAGSLVIGRLKTNQVFLDDASLSREHCRIQFDGRVFMLQDLGSRNGTILNGRKLDMPTPLRPGDRVKVGSYVFRFELDPGDPAPPAQDPAMVAAARNQAAEEAERANNARRVEKKDRDREPLTVQPGSGGLTGWVVMLGIAVGGAFVLRFVFAWAIKILVP